MKIKLILLYVAIALLIILPGSLKAQGQETCPQTGGWTKIDSNDLSLYPVQGATAYCFKAGSDNSQGCTGGLFDSIPENGFGATTGDIKYCGLSHWSYFVPSTTPSPEPSNSPSPTASSTPEVTSTPTTQASSTPEPTQTPTSTTESKPNESSSSNPTPKVLASTGSFEETLYLTLMIFGVVFTGIGIYKLTNN